MTNPIIGVTCYRFLNSQGYPKQSINESYIHSLLKAGACPVMIPSGLNDTNIQDLLSHLDGLMLTGGGDIHPKFYGSADHPLVSEIDVDRDEIELSLLKHCLSLKMPVLGICRGFQLINVGLGGTLYEDIQDQNSTANKHDFDSDFARSFLAHEVNLIPGSKLAEIFGETHIMVNSLHHQGIRLLSDQVEASASAPDGIIEALQIRDYPYGIAVQWHPEEMQTDPKMRALFLSFTQAAMTYRSS